MATEIQVDAHAREFVGHDHPMLIGSDWVDAASGKTFEVLNPATGDLLCRVAEGSSEDIDRAVKTARAAFETGPWHTMKPSERGRLLHKLGDLILEHGEELASLETLDNGKPYAVALGADVPLAADLFHYMSGWCTKLNGQTIQPTVPYMPDAQWHAYTTRDPIGVVGQIIPWNFPLLMAAWKLGPALAAGCTVILKPAEQTPLSALRLGELILEAGIPAGVVNIVTGYGDAGAALAAHNDVDKVAFTGSTEVGKLIVNAAGASNLKKLTLELGGKSPNVVYADTDLETTIPGAAMSIFFNHGQCCAAGSRLFVEDKVYDEVLQGISDIAKGMKVGSGFDSDTDMGPLVSQEQLDRVSGFLDAGAAEGACAVAGGKRIGEQGYFMAPTVLTDTTPDMKVEAEEIFGPVVVAKSFKDASEIAPIANETSYGLAAGVWTKDISKAHATARAIRAGTVWVNCYNVFDAALPFGGYKESGWGREMGGEALNNYLETKCVITQL
ncbi:MAG: aldehyde dehydrogenase family protein [Solirubrobacteraceae bacterium]|nr:aldehyde dehydrogenase family protein [Solirubrobacteraceae bacterium]